MSCLFFFCFMEGEYENPTHILTLHIIEKLMSALCNLDYQVNHQNLMTVCNTNRRHSVEFDCTIPILVIDCLYPDKI